MSHKEEIIKYVFIRYAQETDRYVMNESTYVRGNFWFSTMDFNDELWIR